MGCQTSSSPQPVPTDLPAPATPAVAINVFSTYLTEAAAAQCKKMNIERQACRNDGISSMAFLSALQKLNVFSAMSPSASQYDYEVLIANQVARQDVSSSLGSILHKLFPNTFALNWQPYFFSEITIQWRGVELHSTVIETSGTQQGNDSDLATSVIEQWWTQAQEQHLFSVNYLYAALGASDYFNALAIPETIGNFQLTEQQLHPDPFAGVIARYLHPEFSEAIIDLNVYPILGTLSDDLSPLLHTELSKAQREAQLVADARGYQLIINDPISQFSTNNGKQLGVRLGMEAETQAPDTLYATLYLFIMEDKFIKISTTFPAHISDPLIADAVTKIRVPAESALMHQLRHIP
jgi:hypothetical protein